jgi:superfamily II DNA/RNA helicase
MLPEKKYQNIMTFKELNISDPVLKPLKNKKYETPTPIQKQAIPI